MHGVFCSSVKAVFAGLLCQSESQHASLLWPQRLRWNLGIYMYWDPAVYTFWICEQKSMSGANHR